MMLKGICLLFCCPCVCAIDLSFLHGLCLVPLPICDVLCLSGSAASCQHIDEDLPDVNSFHNRYFLLFVFTLVSFS